ncbi:hypothetical protein SISNIDRAFT_459533 [Sistotremastrum niveocremeum HHB9708]|uniref:F-box domain-containing protein n=1 Tax=Sistotremastrum niveocremeum HHB9708 TaxID=1314777 RepID=A0A164PGA7_9AGAM|nr:hypothetical protein SISNIDRAFT_459533 [Sistotremastrum niveocremeum HHB9708]
MANISRTRNPNPFEILPLDIFRIIMFDEILSSSHEPTSAEWAEWAEEPRYQPRYTRQEIKSARLVCTSWNRLIECDPLIWNVIKIDNRNSIRLAHLAVKRSLGQAVHVFISSVLETDGCTLSENYGPKWDSHIEGYKLLRNVLPRCITLSISISSDSPIHPKLPVVASLEAPLLRRLILRVLPRNFGFNHTRYGPHLGLFIRFVDFLRTIPMPNLKEFSVSDFLLYGSSASVNLDFIPFSQLESLHIKFPATSSAPAGPLDVDEMNSILSRYQNIRNLRIEFPSLVHVVDIQSVLEIPYLTKLILSSCTLLHNSPMTLSSPVALTELSFRGMFRSSSINPGAGAIMDVLAHLPQLKKLQLELSRYVPPPATTPTSLANVEHVLLLAEDDIIFVFFRSFLIPQLRGLSIEWRPLGFPFRPKPNIIDPFPLLQDLEIKPGPRGSPLRIFLPCTPGLRRLIYHDHDPRFSPFSCLYHGKDSPNEPILCPELECIVLADDSNAGVYYPHQHATLDDIVKSRKVGVEQGRCVDMKLIWLQGNDAPESGTGYPFSKF